MKTNDDHVGDDDLFGKVDPVGDGDHDDHDEVLRLGAVSGLGEDDDDDNNTNDDEDIFLRLGAGSGLGDGERK